MSENYGQANYQQYGQDLPYYINGFQISNDATTPNTLLDIGPGSCLDVTGSFQLNSNSNIVINAAVNGLNGLDTGTFAQAKVYAVYVVWDPVTLQAPGAMISLSLTAPLMPYGYSAYLLIGYATTVSNAAHFLPGYWSAGNGSMRTFTYDAFQATPLTSGSSTTYIAVNLIALVPNVPNTPVQIYSNYLPGTAGDTLSLQAGLATGAQVIITGQVATVHVSTISTVLAQPVAISLVVSPAINYKVSSSGDAVAIDVAGYTWFV